MSLYCVELWIFAIKFLQIWNYWRLKKFLEAIYWKNDSAMSKIKNRHTSSEKKTYLLTSRNIVTIFYVYSFNILSDCQFQLSSSFFWSPHKKNYEEKLTLDISASLYLSHIFNARVCIRLTLVLSCSYIIIRNSMVLLKIENFFKVLCYLCCV